MKREAGAHHRTHPPAGSNGHKRYNKCHSSYTGSYHQTVVRTARDGEHYLLCADLPLRFLLQ